VWSEGDAPAGTWQQPNGTASPHGKEKKEPWLRAVQGRGVWGEL